MRCSILISFLMVAVSRCGESVRMDTPGSAQLLHSHQANGAPTAQDAGFGLASMIWPSATSLWLLSGIQF